MLEVIKRGVMRRTIEFFNVIREYFRRTSSYATTPLWGTTMFNTAIASNKSRPTDLKWKEKFISY